MKIAGKAFLFLAAFFAFLIVAASGAFAAQYEKTDSGIVLNVGQGKLKVEACGDSIFHVLFSPDGKFSDRKSLVRVYYPKAGGTKWNVKEDVAGTTVSLTTEKAEAVIPLKTGAVEFLDKSGKSILHESENGRIAEKAEVSGEKVWQVKQIFSLSPDEGLYGLGQYQDGVMNWRGHDVVMGQVNTKIAVPFMLSTAGYGILWDNYSLTKFHDGADGASFWSEVADGIDYYFVYGPAPDEVIAGYRLLTGKAPMFGKWAYGYWQSKERYKTDKELLDVAKEYRDRKLPIDNIVQDWMYWGKYSWNAMKFDEDTYPHPAETFDKLHKDYHFHIMISIWPKFGGETAIYKELKNKGWIISGQDPKADAALYDAYNKDARDLYWKRLNDGVFSKGIDAWWMDATEPEVAGGRDPEAHAEALKKLGPWSIGTTARYLNTFALATSQGVYENMRKQAPEKRVFILTRSGFAGQQRNGTASWSGDILASWDVFSKQIPAGLNFGMAGVPYWTTDIGAFHVWFIGGVKHDEYKELYVRWFQYGAFCPVFRSHGTHTPREIWQFGEKGTWAYDALEKADNLRYRLMPYIYSLAWKVTDSGYTIMRGLPMDFPGDADARNISDQFMFGPALLVNPVTRAMYNWEQVNGATAGLRDQGIPIQGKIKHNSTIQSRDVYLPKAPGWYDFWTGRRFDGGQKIKADAPIDIIPLFVKAGSIIPVGPFIQYAAEKPADPIELRIYPGADGEFVIYEDENDNYNYEKGTYATIPIKWNDASKTLTIGERRGEFPGMLKKRTFSVVLVGDNHGVGLPIEEKPDSTVNYEGKQLAVTLK